MQVVVLQDTRRNLGLILLPAVQPQQQPPFSVIGRKELFSPIIVSVVDAKFAVSLSVPMSS
jgi:hypothetical protein